jgi:hypothetical protein
VHEVNLFLPKLQELIRAATRHQDTLTVVDQCCAEPPPSPHCGPTTSVSFHRLEVAPLNPPVHPMLKLPVRAHLVDQRAATSRADTVLYFFNFVFNLNSRNQFKIPKFMEKFRKIRKIQTKFSWNP